MPSPIDFRKLFKDTTKYPDTLKIKIGDDSELELGVLRAWNTENEGALVAELETQRKALATETAKIDRARQEVAAQYLDVAKIRDDLKNQPKPRESAAADPYSELGDDPIVGELAKLVKTNADKAASDMAAIREENKKLLDAIGKMGVTYMNDRAGQDYSSLTADPDYDAKDESLSQQRLYETAVKSGYRDVNGIPDIRKAYKEATSEKRVARLVKEAREDERKVVAEERRQQAILPRPSGPRSAASVETPQFKDIDGALAAAMEDKAIWNQTGAGEA